MGNMSGAAIVGMTGLIILRGWMTGCDAYSAFLRGAEKGMKSALALLPALSGMLLMLALMNASGLAQLLSRLISPVMTLIHLPEEVAPILLLRPLTGSGSLAALESIYEICGVDSRAGRISSVLMGSSETIFYTMTLYLGAAGIKKLPNAMIVSLAAYLFSAALCGWLM